VIVIPAQAGIHSAVGTSFAWVYLTMDSRLRGNDRGDIMDLNNL